MVVTPSQANEYHEAAMTRLEKDRAPKRVTRKDLEEVVDLMIWEQSEQETWKQRVFLTEDDIMIRLSRDPWCKTVCMKDSMVESIRTIYSESGWYVQIQGRYIVLLSTG